jgi:hypothetical protein
MRTRVLRRRPRQHFMSRCDVSARRSIRCDRGKGKSGCGLGRAEQSVLIGFRRAARQASRCTPQSTTEPPNPRAVAKSVARRTSREAFNALVDQAIGTCEYDHTHGGERTPKCVSHAFAPQCSSVSEIEWHTTSARHKNGETIRIQAVRGVFVDGCRGPTKVSSLR